tara:strand:- start:108 stop:404 length:297 start_codon:yes stop_codon:yes gene_type:complete
MSSSREIREDAIIAGKEAAVHLIEVAKAKIIVKDNSKDPLAADKMKTAAAAKKVAIFDCFDILDRCDKEEAKLAEGSESTAKEIPKNVDFRSAEERTT